MKRKRMFRRPSKNTGVNLLGILAIIIAAALAGFLLTKFIVYPVMLGTFTPQTEQSNPQPKAEPKDSEKSPEKKVDGADDAQTDEQLGDKTASDIDKGNTSEPASGYGIQFGSFATKAAADELLSQLEASGIKASAIEKDGNFKVVGEIFGDKEAARAAAAAIDKTIYSDIFITDI